MARGAWNRTLTVQYGPTSVVGMPGLAYRFGVPCRLVYQNKIVQTEYADSVSFAWVTYEGPEFNFYNAVSVGAGVYTIDYGSADQVFIDSDPGTLLVVLRGEEVFPTPRPAYYRSLVADVSAFSPPLPPPPLPPPPTPTPGVACGSAGVIAPDTVYSWTSPVGGPPMWWRLPGGASGPPHWLSTDFPVGGGNVMGGGSGVTCGSTFAITLGMVHPGCYVIITSAGPDLWLNFLTVGPSPITFSFEVKTTSC